MDLRFLSHVAAKRHTLTRRFLDNNLDIIVFTYVKSSHRFATGGAQRVYLSDTHALMRVKRGKTLVLDNANGGVYGWVTNCTYPFRL